VSVPEKKLRLAVWHNLFSGGGKRALRYHADGLDRLENPLHDLIAEKNGGAH